MQLKLNKIVTLIMKPTLINNIEFADKNLEIAGNIDADNCERLVEIISKSTQNVANIRYKLTGASKKLRLPSLHLSINAKLPVLCQRCLEEMSLDFALELDYVISDTAPSEVEESDEIDWLEASQEMDLTALIEDELLIAMPIAPMHETDCLKTSLQSGEKPNPFAVLKGKFK